MREAKLSRRDTLKILGAVPVLSAVVSACGPKGPPDSCSDTNGLSEPEKMARNALQYVDHSPQPDKKCNGCQHYVAPPEISQCGSCKVVKGPIHPEGYCTSWVKKA
jgi:hypothetical protein